MRTPFLVLVLVVAATSCSVARSDIDDTQHPAVACTLTPAELSARRAQLIPGLIDRAESVTDLENGLLLRFGSSPGLLGELADVIDAERTCCSFLRFTVTAKPAGGVVTFEVTGPPGTREMLRSL